jgi:alpha-tubulin suppressor-like RCC1 family protein
VAGIKGATLLALGERLSCAVGDDKQLACWGLPGYSDENSDKRGFTPRPLPAFGEVEAVHVRGGSVCSINKAKEASCESVWDLGSGAPKPLKLGAVKGLISGSSVSAALLASGQVILWGRDWNKPEDVLKANVSGLADVTQLAADSSTVCGLRRSGKVGCAGFHYRTFDKKEPVKPASAVDVPGLTDVVSLVSADGEYCAVRKTGEVACWSSYRIPQPVDPKREAERLKDKSKDKDKSKPKPDPIVVKPVKGIADAVQVAAGGGTRCALLKAGTLMCWGSNGYGQLGIGTYETGWDPVSVPGLTDVARVAVGGGHVCAIKKGGDVMCWGRNMSDEAGQPAAPYARAPVSVVMPK